MSPRRPSVYPNTRSPTWNGVTPRPGLHDLARELIPQHPDPRPGDTRGRMIQGLPDR